MKSDRLVVLLAPEEKGRLVALARARHSSVGELVREAVARLGASPTATTADAQEFALNLIRQGCEKIRDNDDGSEWWRGSDGHHFLVVPKLAGQRHSRSHTTDRVMGIRASAGPRIAATDQSAAPTLSADQTAALERLADVALQTMQRANAALDKAFEEIEATKAYLAAKRGGPGARA